jgi:predicted membrane chloride channel (bestrophin family)
MIIYRSGPFGLPTMLNWTGSVLPRSSIFGLLAAAAAVGLKLGGEAPTIERWWRAAVLPYQLFAFALGFVVTFRASLSYNRYWEAAGALMSIQQRMVELVVRVRACLMHACGVHARMRGLCEVCLQQTPCMLLPYAKIGRYNRSGRHQETGRALSG